MINNEPWEVFLFQKGPSIYHNRSNDGCDVCLGKSHDTTRDYEIYDLEF